MSKSKFKVDFIGVGAGRSGTTFLAKCLDEHPDIGMADVKEVEFFNKTRSIVRRQRGDISWNYPKGISWYKNHFPSRDKFKLIGEYSADYLVDKETPVLIKKHFPNVKIIISLRDPIDRAYSLYWFYKQGANLEESETFEDAIDKRDGYLKKSLYADSVLRYLKTFGSDNVLILFYCDLKGDPGNVIKTMYNFLEVKDDYVPLSLEKKINTAYVYKHGGISQFLHDGVTILERLGLETVLRLLKKMKVYQLIRDVHDRLNRRSYKYPQIKSETRTRLIKYFRKDVLKLEKIVDRDLSLWLK